MEKGNSEGNLLKRIRVKDSKQLKQELLSLARRQGILARQKRLIARVLSERNV